MLHIHMSIQGWEMNIRQSSNLDGMRGEISVIKGVHADIVESFNDYRLLKETDG